MKEIIDKHELHSLYKPKNYLKQTDLEKILKIHFKKEQIKTTIKHLKKQCTNWKLPEQIKIFTPNRTLISGIATILKNEESIHRHYDNSYIPQGINNMYKQTLQLITKADHNPHWYVKTRCPCCNRITTFSKLHKLLSCEKYKNHRKQVFDSITTEICFYRQKYNDKQIHKQTYYRYTFMKPS